MAGRLRPTRELTTSRRRCVLAMRAPILSSIAAMLAAVFSTCAPRPPVSSSKSRVAHPPGASQAPVGGVRSTASGPPVRLPKGQPAASVLSRLLFKGPTLPAVCLVSPFPPKKRLPFPVKSNPQLSTDPAFIRAFLKKLLGPTPHAGQVTEALFAIYHQKGAPTPGPKEIGLFAFRFADAKAVRTLKPLFSATMQKQMGVQGRPGTHPYHIIARGKVVAVLWSDQAIRFTCYRALVKKVSAVIARSAR